MSKLSEHGKGETCWISLCFDIWQWRGHLPPAVFLHTVTLFHHVVLCTCHTFIPVGALTEPDSLPQSFSVSNSPVLMPATDVLLDFCSCWISDLWETLLPLWPTSNTVPPCVRTATLTPFNLSWLPLDPLCCGTLNGRRQMVQSGPLGSLPCHLLHHGLGML